MVPPKISSSLRSETLRVSPYGEGYEMTRRGSSLAASIVCCGHLGGSPLGEPVRDLLVIDVAKPAPSSRRKMYTDETRMRFRHFPVRDPRRVRLPLSL